MEHEPVHGTPATARDARRTRFGEIARYPAGLHHLQHGIYAWLVPNGSWGESNAGLIVGQGASLLVDTCWDVPHTLAMLKAMRPLTAAAPIKYVVNTHADSDHWWGNQLVGHAEIITSKASYDEMSHLQPRSLILLSRIGRLLSHLPLFNADRVGHWLYNMLAPYDVTSVTPKMPTRTFQGELVLDVGGRDVHLIEVGPAHTHGDLLVYVPDAKALFSADILFLGSTPVIWAGPLENWLAALDRILHMDVEVIIPGHGPPTDKSGVREVRAYWEYVEEQVSLRYQAGMSPREAACDIALSDDFARQPFADWNSPERMMTNVHILYRHLQGRAKPFGQIEQLNLMRKQALLAHQLPDAQPASLRKR